MRTVNIPAFKLRPLHLYMAGEIVSPGVIDIGYASIGLVIIIGVAVISGLIYSIVLDCRERREDNILRDALLQNAH
jgi:hypothetical protein